jgi:hypothetical protein
MRWNRVIACIAALFLLAGILHASIVQDSAVPLPAGWSGPVFRLSQNYPTSIPNDAYPWMNFDPTTDHKHSKVRTLVSSPRTRH